MSKLLSFGIWKDENGIWYARVGESIVSFNDQDETIKFIECFFDRVKANGKDCPQKNTDY